MKKIKLWKNSNELSDIYAVIDDEDYEKVINAVRNKRSRKEGKWYAHIPAGSKHYAMSGGRRKSIHRVVMGNPKGMCIDHINGDTLDNRKQNLRICTKAQNSQNKKLRRDSASGFKGVAKEPSGRYSAYIGDPNTAYPKKRHIRLGTYSTAEEAARVYDRNALKLHGEYAYTNFPIEDYQ